MGNREQAVTKAQWQALYDDGAALVKSPEGHQHALIELAEALRAQGVIDDAELAELLESADAAYQWGVEAQITEELNRKDLQP
jgi:lantibiotic modifying enzyme